MSPLPVLLRSESDTWAARVAQLHEGTNRTASETFRNDKLSSAAVTNSAAVPHTSQSFQGKGDARFPPGRPPSSNGISFEWNAIGLEDKLAIWRARAQPKEARGDSEHQSIEEWIAPATLRLEPNGDRATWVVGKMEQLTRQVATRQDAMPARIEEVQADEASLPLLREEIGREGGDDPRGAQSKPPSDTYISDVTLEEAELRVPAAAHGGVESSTVHGSRAQVPKPNQASSAENAPSAVPEQENGALGGGMPGREWECGVLSPLSFVSESGLGTVQDCAEPLSQRGFFRGRSPRRPGPTSPPPVGLWVTVTCGQRGRQIMADDRSTDARIPCEVPLRFPRPNTEDMAGLAVELASLKDPIAGVSDRFSRLATLTEQTSTEMILMGRDRTWAPHGSRGHGRGRRHRRGGRRHQRVEVGSSGYAESTATGAVTAGGSNGEAKTNSDAATMLEPDLATAMNTKVTTVMDSGGIAMIDTDMAARRASEGPEGMDSGEKGAENVTPVAVMGMDVEAATESGATVVPESGAAATQNSDRRVATGSGTEERRRDVGAMGPVVAAVRQSDTAEEIGSDGEAMKDSDMAMVGSTSSCQPQAELGRMAKTDPDAVLAMDSDGNGDTEGSREPEEEEGISAGTPRNASKSASVEVLLVWDEARLRVKVVREDWEEMQDLGLMIDPGLAVGFAWRRSTPGRRRPMPTIRPVSPEAMEVPSRHWPSSWEGLVQHVASGGSFRVHRRMRGGAVSVPPLDKLRESDLKRLMPSRSEQPGLVPPAALPNQGPVVDGTGDAAGAPDNPSAEGH